MQETEGRKGIHDFPPIFIASDSFSKLISRIVPPITKRDNALHPGLNHSTIMCSIAFVHFFFSFHFDFQSRM